MSEHGDHERTAEAQAAAALLQSVRERRVMSLALAEEIGLERWNAPLLPGERTAHALYSHLLAWDEWATAVFELSALRALSEKLVRPYLEVDAFNARSVARFAGLPREDLLMGLQGANARLIAAALGADGAAWFARRIPDLAPPGAGTPEKPSRGPSVGGLLRLLLNHEREHNEEISATYGVSVDLERLRAQSQERRS
jgi:hypothetical protein